MSLPAPIVELIFSVFGLLICSTLIIALFFKLISKLCDLCRVIGIHPVKSNDKLLAVITVISIGFYGIGCAMSCFFLLTVMYFGTEQYAKIRGLIWIFGGGFYLFGQWLLLFTFAIRLSVTFSDLPFIRFNYSTINAMYVAISSLLILIIAMFVTIGLKQRVYTIIIASIWTLLNLTASVVMMILFLTKVFAVMRYKASFALQQDEQMDSDEKSKEAACVHRVTIDLSDVKSATRYALLVSIANISTFLSMIIMVVITMVHEYDAYDNDQELGALEFLFVALDSLVNACCLYLLFEFNRIQYYKICDFGHGLVEKCCIRCVVEKMTGVDDHDAQREPIDYEDLILR